MAVDVASELSLTNLARPEVRADPYPFYAQLRAQDPVHWDEGPRFWVLSRFDDVVNAFHDPRFSRAEGLAGWRRRLPEAERAGGEAVYDAFSHMMTYSDPPYHTRLRGLVNKAFTPRLVEQMRPRIQRLVDDLLDAAAGQGEMDIIRDLAFPVPVIVIAELLGLPSAERGHFKKWSDDLFAVLGVVRQKTGLMDQAAQSLDDLSQFVIARVEERRAAPQDDLLSALVSVVDEGNRLSVEELTANVGLLLAAAHETTTNLIGNGLLALLRHPDQLAALQADPDLIQPATEEILRYESPAQIVYRSVTEDVTLDGKTIRAGELVNLLLGSANRDPAQFADPDTFDIRRSVARHSAFGLGIHFCVGAPLARIEGQIAIASMLRRFLNLRLAAETLEWNDHPTFRGLRALPVAL